MLSGTIKVDMDKLIKQLKGPTMAEIFYINKN